MNWVILWNFMSIWEAFLDCLGRYVLPNIRFMHQLCFYFVLIWMSGCIGLIASSILRLIDFGQEAEEDPEQLLRRRYGNSVGSLISVDVVKHEGLRTLCGSKWVGLG
ncbi:hypothetical protein HanOQP8_Chr16g0602791 [Helianthus annuus]|nr:hypothetical protein HanOQP8_Chr16g0602791 [Helianthus annuus]